jgi:hypothetical protein
MDKIEAAARKYCELRGWDPEEWIDWDNRHGYRWQKFLKEATDRYAWQEALKYGEEMDEPGNFGPTITVNRADYHRMREQNGLMRKEIVELQKYHRETFDRLQDQVKKAKEALVKSEDAAKYYANLASDHLESLNEKSQAYDAAMLRIEQQGQAQQDLAVHNFEIVGKLRDERDNARNKLDKIREEVGRRRFNSLYALNDKTFIDFINGMFNYDQG